MSGDCQSDDGAGRLRRPSAVSALVAKLQASRTALLLVGMIAGSLFYAGTRIGSWEGRLSTVERELAEVQARVLCLVVPALCPFTLPAKGPAPGGIP